MSSGSNDVIGKVCLQIMYIEYTNNILCRNKFIMTA